MDRFWLEEARRYIIEHRAFSDVSPIRWVRISGTHKLPTISATVSVGLPSRFIGSGVTDTGVEDRETVTFVFPKQFPLKAPEIHLRDDFQRSFPHIYPSELRVIPCIYEGDPSELLQQPEWMNGILNQLVDWLEKAASGDLMNYDQGWEPMRSDRLAGCILYGLDEAINSHVNNGKSLLNAKIRYCRCRGKILASLSSSSSEWLKSCETIRSSVVHLVAPGTVPTYIPNPIVDLGGLYQYAKSIGIHDVGQVIERVNSLNIEEDKLFVLLSIKRPAKLIGSHSDIELLNFVIHKKEAGKKKGDKMYAVSPECKVEMLGHIEDRSPSLLGRLSGSKAVPNDTKVALVGCGSLGSKIAMHLARNGNGPFLLIDHDIFMPHNNARHALASTSLPYKADLLAESITTVSGLKAEPIRKSVLDINPRLLDRSRIVVDTTASLSVRNLLISRQGLPPVASGCLYGQGRFGLLLLENKSKSSRLSDIWAHVYHWALTDESLREALFSSKETSVQIGQSCSSRTMIVDDARISLMAAIMATRIQTALAEGLPESGEVLFSRCPDNYSVETAMIPVPEVIIPKVRSTREQGWQIRVSRSAYEDMMRLMQMSAPNETGGALVGSVFQYAKTAVITGIVCAPPDSREGVGEFVLGIDGLERRIVSMMEKTNGRVTYIGTWHSHPRGGAASRTDQLTYERLRHLRNGEPTVCLVVSEDEAALVQ